MKAGARIYGIKCEKRLPSLSPPTIWPEFMFENVKMLRDLFWRAGNKLLSPPTGGLREEGFRPKSEREFG